MAFRAPHAAVLALGLCLSLAPLAGAREGRDLAGRCDNPGARGLTAERDLWTGFWQLNTVGRAAVVLSGTRLNAVYAGGALSGEVPYRLWRVEGTFRGSKPMRPETASSGRFEIEQALSGRAFTGTWFAKDREGEEDKGVLRGTYLSGFWQGGWRTNLGHVVFSHPAPKTDKRLVRGRYPWSGGGSITACVERLDARALTGFYRDKTGFGTFTIYLTRDRSRFSGTYVTPDRKRTGRWTGEFVAGPVKR